MLKAVLFDLGGTLAYASLDISPFAPLILQLRPSIEQRQQLIDLLLTTNLNTVAQIAALIPTLIPGKQMSPEIQQSVQDVLAQHVQSFKRSPGALELCEWLRSQSLHLALLSNLMSPYKQVLVNIGLESYFECICFSCDLGFMKPDRRIFTKALEFLHVSPNEAVMIGDNPYDDIEGARAMGIRSLLVVEREGIPDLSVIKEQISELM